MRPVDYSSDCLMGHDWVEGNCLVCHQIAGAHLRILIKMLRGPHQGAIRSVDGGDLWQGGERLPSEFSVLRQKRWLPDRCGASTPPNFGVMVDEKRAVWARSDACLGSREKGPAL